MDPVPRSSDPHVFLFRLGLNENEEQLELQVLKVLKLCFYMFLPSGSGGPVCLRRGGRRLHVCC